MRKLKFGWAFAIAALSIVVCAQAAPAHTVTNTVGIVAGEHCLVRSISLRETSSGPQMYGYQSPWMNGCTRPMTGDDLRSSNAQNEFTLKLFIFTGTGPYLNGYAICRNKTYLQSFPTDPVTNQFTTWSRGPCGSGHYASAICTEAFSAFTTSDSHFTWNWNDCSGPATHWLWTNDWHYFS